MDFSDLRPYLCPLALDLLEVLGLERFTRLVNRFGGVAVYVPKKSTGGSLLAVETDVDTERLMVERWGTGAYLQIPNCKLALSEWRRDQLLADRAQHSAVVVALKWGVTDRQVRRQREKWGLPMVDSPPPDPQQDLFK